MERINDLLHPPRWQERKWKFDGEPESKPIQIKKYKYCLYLIDDKYRIWSCGIDLIAGDRVVVRKLHGDKQNWVGTVTQRLKNSDSIVLPINNIILEKYQD